MAICRPGMPSKANRAATSLMRVAPLVITTNWITTMIDEDDQADDQILSPADELAEALHHAAGRQQPLRCRRASESSAWWPR